MVRWFKLLMICISLALLGCTAGSGEAPVTGSTKHLAPLSTPMTAQQAIDVVYKKVGDNSAFSDFPRTIGSKQGAVGLGGPPPGVTEPASFSTEASETAEGGFEVRLIRRWGQSDIQGTTIWTFKVEATGNVDGPVRTGAADPPPVP